MAAWPLIAQGGTGSPPAGGGEIEQVVGATAGAALITGAMFALVLAHRSGRTNVLRRLGDLAERQTGLPGWASLPMTVLAGSLIVAVFGMYWDIATHIDAGRDEGPLANASHYFILAGLFGVFLAGLLAIFLPDEKPGPAALKLRDGWYVPLGGALVLLCSALALSAFPLDDVWHRIFGQDVTLWGPTHLVLFGGAALSVVGAAVLGVEGVHARGRRGPTPELGRVTTLRKLLRLGYAGAFLIALSTFQGEFDYAVPQFRLILHPILLMLAASLALIAARVYLGRGAAFAAVGMFLLIRGGLSLLVSPVFGHTGLHFPLYVVEAALVELVALRVDSNREPLRFGLIAGAAIGTVGLAAEWGWSHVWWTIEWPSSLLPEAAIAGFITAVAGGVVGALVGRALLAEPRDRTVPRWAAPAAGLAIVAVLVYAVPDGTRDEPVRAQVELREVKPPPEREVEATVRLIPSDAAEDAHWFVTTAWQGNEGRSVVDPLEQLGEGVYRTTKPVPVHGTWKASLRLHEGTAVEAMPIYFPPDDAIPVEGIPARERFTRRFIEDKKLLLREQKEGVSGALVAFAYITVLLIALLLVGAIAAALVRLRRQLTADAAPREGGRFQRSGQAAGRAGETVSARPG
jgi:hypothetical protein